MGLYMDAANALQDSLKLNSPPIAVCFADDVPEGVPAFKETVPAGCVFWQEAANRVFSTSTKDHELCSIGVYTHNLADPSASYESELGSVLNALAGMEYVRQEDIPAIPVLERRYKHVIYGPLAEVPLQPDAVMLFVNSRQGLIITEAVQQIETGIPPALGRPACAVVPQAIKTQRASLSLGCCGARAYLDAFTDDIAIWALPGKSLEKYVEKISKLAYANDALGKFHQLRRRDVEGGLTPTYAESLARLGG